MNIYLIKWTSVTDSRNAISLPEQGRFSVSWHFNWHHTMAMKYIFIFLTTIMSMACNDNKTITSKSTITDAIKPEEPSKYSDSLILSEQEKTIGDIKFGMTEKKVKLLIDKFKDETKKPDGILGKPYYDYFIGNYEYSQINDFYHNKKLYRLEINGEIILWDNYNLEIVDKINSITEVLKQKFGEPDISHPIPERYQMENGFTYLVRAWNIGQKRIEIRIEDNSTSYFTSVIIYFPAIEKVIEVSNSIKKDSITKANKNVF